MRIRQSLWSSLLRSEIISAVPLDHLDQPIQLTSTIPSARTLISRSPLQRPLVAVLTAALKAQAAQIRKPSEELRTQTLAHTAVARN